MTDENMDWPGDRRWVFLLRLWAAHEVMDVHNSIDLFT